MKKEEKERDWKRKDGKERKGKEKDEEEWKLNCNGMQSFQRMGWQRKAR